MAWRGVLKVQVLNYGMEGSSEAPSGKLSGSHLSRLEEEDGNLAKIEVDEVLGLVRDVGAEIAAHAAVPGRVVLLVKLFLDEGGNVFLNVVLFKCLRGTVYGILLHVLGHVSILDHRLPVSHVSGLLGKILGRTGNC